MRLMQHPKSKIPEGEYYCPKDKDTLLQYREWTSQQKVFQRFFCDKCGQLYEIADIQRLQQNHKQKLEADYEKSGL